MPTKMRQEIDEIPQAAERLLSTAQHEIAAIGKQLKTLDPVLIATIGRGSSDHAAHFLKYAIELQLGLPVASLGPSLASIYNTPMKMKTTATLSISQSGSSPDIVNMSETARAGKSLTIALVNTLPSPLAAVTNLALDIQAGPELAVASTKSYVNSIIAGLAIVAAWDDDQMLKDALVHLPEQLNEVLSLDWSFLVETFKPAQSLYILGRGPTLAVATEAALKCKETCELHAEAYSAAEVLHGPVSLVDSDFPIIAFAARDQAEASIINTVAPLTKKNDLCFISSSNPAGNATPLPFMATGHPLTDALALVVSFYGFIEALSRARGYNPDKPVALKKVTKTK